MQLKQYLEEILQLLNVYFRKKESFLNNKLNLHLKKLEREVQMKPKPSRIKENHKNRRESKEIENRKQRENERENQRREKTRDTQSWFTKQINTTDKSIARLTK